MTARHARNANDNDMHPYLPVPRPRRFSPRVRCAIRVCRNLPPCMDWKRALCVPVWTCCSAGCGHWWHGQRGEGKAACLIRLGSLRSDRKPCRAPMHVTPSAPACLPDRAARAGGGHEQDPRRREGELLFQLRARRGRVPRRLGPRAGGPSNATQQSLFLLSATLPLFTRQWPVLGDSPRGGKSPGWLRAA